MSATSLGRRSFGISNLVTLLEKSDTTIENLGPADFISFLQVTTATDNHTNERFVHAHCLGKFPLGAEFFDDPFLQLPKHLNHLQLSNGVTPTHILGEKIY
jgi:hypothetical protein